MSGWLMLIAFAALAAALLAALRFPKRLWTVAATALTLGAAGYAWQGKPDLPGHPVSTEKAGAEVDPDLIAMREAIFGRFNLEYSYFQQSDAMARLGEPELAAKAMIGAVAKVPDDAALWTWLGMTLADSDKGLVTPASQLAFEKAIALGPKHPGPLYFYGLALARSGKTAEGRALWVRAIALTPEKMAYRADLVAQLERLDAFIAAQGGAVPVEPAPDDASGNEAESVQ
jgi:tetratricopeptide (TPR) repeat protein